MSAHQATIARDQLAEQPSTTVKHQAIIEFNRGKFEKQRATNSETNQSDYKRYV
jgi:hypothetical protein